MTSYTCECNKEIHLSPQEEVIAQLLERDWSRKRTATNFKQSKIERALDYLYEAIYKKYDKEYWKRYEGYNEV